MEKTQEIKGFAHATQWIIFTFSFEGEYGTTQIKYLESHTCCVCATIKSHLLFFYFFSNEKSSPIFRYNKIKECLMCQNHGLKNWEISPIFWRNIGYWRWPKQNQPPIIDWRKNCPKICKISPIFWWLADFSAKISSVTAHAHGQGKTSKKRAKKSTIFWKITDLSPINC